MKDSEIVKGMIVMIWRPEKLEEVPELGRCMDLYGRMVLAEAASAAFSAENAGPPSGGALSGGTSSPPEAPSAPLSL